MKILHRFYILFFLFFPSFSYCQYQDDKESGIALIDFEKRIDSAIVIADMQFLQAAYADDFRFKHSTGHIDDKISWLKDVEKSKGVIISRTLSEVEVEIHGDIGITNGILTVKRKDKIYKLQYVRVYIKKVGQWRMIMHRSVHDLT